MEDLKAYIESGVLELYVLGELTEAEKLEVELMLKKHPQLQNELLEIEKALYIYAERHATNPPESLRSKILDTLETSEESPFVPISSSRSNNFYKYAFAASIALLLLSIIAIINLYSQLKESNTQLAILKESNQQFSSRVNYVEEQLQNTRQTVEIFRNQDQYKLVTLKGTPNSPASSMMVAFNSQKAEVMIDLESVKMPAHDESHQYQLWALVDGKPVDLGVFDTAKDGKGMIKMKSLKTAQAFAVTLEPKGGSVSPTLEQMIVMGNI